jgi:fimbrial chaperone protein
MMRSGPTIAARGGILLALLSLAIGPAFAGSIAVNPIRVALSASKTTGVLVVRNNGAEPSVVQMEIVSWSQHEGKDVLVPTKELLATPPIFTVPPGGSQTVRVGLRQGADPRREVSYRVIMQEVPPPPQPEFRGLQVALRLSVPVFVAPAIAAAPTLQWQANINSQGDLDIAATNSGNAHVQVLNFKLSVAGAELLPTAQPEAAYILPDQQHGWTLRFKPAPAVGTALRVVAHTDAGESKSEFVVK